MDVHSLTTNIHLGGNKGGIEPAQWSGNDPDLGLPSVSASCFWWRQKQLMIWRQERCLWWIKSISVWVGALRQTPLSLDREERRQEATTKSALGLSLCKLNCQRPVLTLGSTGVHRVKNRVRKKTYSHCLSKSQGITNQVQLLTDKCLIEILGRRFQNRLEPKYKTWECPDSSRGRILCPS